MESYNTLFSNIKGISTDLKYADYSGGNTLYAFDLSPDLCNGDHYSIMKSGTLSVSMTLGEDIDYSITMVVHMEFDNTIEIDEERNIFTDYSL